MVVLTPDQPWLYLIIYAGFMLFAWTFGLILTISQKRKKQKLEKNVEKSTNI